MRGILMEGCNHCGYFQKTVLCLHEPEVEVLHSPALAFAKGDRPSLDNGRGKGVTHLMQVGGDDGKPCTVWMSKNIDLAVL